MQFILAIKKKPVHFFFFFGGGTPCKYGNVPSILNSVWRWPNVKQILEIEAWHKSCQIQQASAWVKLTTKWNCRVNVRYLKKYVHYFFYIYYNERGLVNVLWSFCLSYQLKYKICLSWEWIQCFHLKVFVIAWKSSKPIPEANFLNKFGNLPRKLAIAIHRCISWNF